MTEINGHVFEIWKAPQIDAQGRVTGTLSVNTDVTRRVTIERELQARLRQQEAIAAIGKSALEGESLERLARRAAEYMAQALEADLAGLWILPPDGGSLPALAMAGAATGELAAGEFRLAASGSLAAHVIATRAPVIVGELASETRFRPHPAVLRMGFASAIATAFGPIRGGWGVLSAYARGTAKFSLDDANFIEAVAHILASASANAETRQELQRGEAYFRGVIEHTSDVVSVVDRRGIIRFVGGSTEDLFGVKSAYLRGTASIELVAPEWRKAVAEATRHSFGHPGEVTRVEFPVRRADSSWPACEAIMKSVTNLTDEIVPVVSLRDVSIRKRHEDAIAHARDVALESVRLKSAFLANMSHEVRTPVNIIMGYSDLIAAYLAERGDETQTGFLDAIARAGRRLLRTIDAILDYSRLSAKSLEMTPRSIPIGPLLERELGQMEAAAEAKNLTLAYVNEAADAEVWCDEHCLTRALQHLLDNAIKFTQQGEVRVRAYRDHDGAIRIDISDTGIGIDPAFLPRLLEPFSQEDSGFNRRFEGSGLGLALTRGYLECNGARLVASSQKGAGSVFSLIFPLTVDCTGAAPPAH
jgi:PAS domain S-box-containing protein